MWLLGDLVLGWVLCIGHVGVDRSLGYGICIFDITIQFQFRRIGWVVLGYAWYFLPSGIVSIATLVWLSGW